MWNWPAEYAALAATALLDLVRLLFGYKDQRVPLREIVKAVVSTGGAVVDLILICAVAGMFIGILNITGLAFGLTLQLLAITGESLPAMLVVTALMAIALGLGLPTVGVYIIMATLIAPALVKVGRRADGGAHVPALLRHHVDGDAAGGAVGLRRRQHRRRSDVDKTGWTATRIGWAAYIVPFLFVLSPSLLMQGPPHVIAWAVLTAASASGSARSAWSGYFYRPVGGAMRALFIVAGVLTLIPADMFPGAILTDIAGLALGAALIARELYQHKWQSS